MKIVYGVSGEGLGHVFEAIQVIGRLQAEGHAVKVLTYGDRACESLAAFAPTRIEGVHLCFDERGMSLPATVRRNLPILPFYLRHGRRLRRELEAFRPDVFLTAYEPYTTIMAHVLKKPLVSMDNQNELLHLRPPAGTDLFGFRLVQLATFVATRGAAEYVIKSFLKAADPGPRLHYVSPVIQDEIRRLHPTEDGPVLVYLTKPNPELVAVLRTLPGTFVVYCHNQVGREGNVTHRAKGPHFLEDLARAPAIIGTTGFSLIADAIYLRKPYFGVPLKKQFEQTYNAQFLVRAGFGASSEAPTREELAGFLGRLPAYRERLAGLRFDPAEQEETLLRILASLQAAALRPRPVL
jgi:uncharacterized protein (TIGR00661 family)